MRMFAAVVVALAGTALVGTVAPPAQAQAYPDKPIRLVVPFPPGGSTDVLARALSRERGTPLSMEVLQRAVTAVAGENAAAN